MRPRTCGSGMLPTRRSEPPPTLCSPAVTGTAAGVFTLLSACELNRTAEQEEAAQKASRTKQGIALVFTNALPSSRRVRGSLPRLTLRDVHTAECGTQSPRRRMIVQLIFEVGCLDDTRHLQEHGVVGEPLVNERGKRAQPARALCG